MSVRTRDFLSVGDGVRVFNGMPEYVDFAAWVPLAVAALACTFVGLFAYDVHRTRRASQQPTHMLSELAFNWFMNSSMAVFAGAVLLKLASLAGKDLVTAAVASCATIAVCVGIHAAATRAEEVPTDSVPDFMRCDGEFVVPSGSSLVNPLASWCGWLRFEGHGTCRIQSSAESAQWITCTWHVEAKALRIAIPQEARAALNVRELYARQGDSEDTVDVGLAAGSAPVCCFIFVPDEADDHDDG